MNIKDVNKVYIGNNGDMSAGLYPEQFEISGGLIFQPGLFGDDDEAKQALEDFRADLKKAFSHVIDPVDYVMFDFEIEHVERQYEEMKQAEDDARVHYHGESWELGPDRCLYDWNGPGWYFYDETEHAHGPFSTSDEAHQQLEVYAKNV